MIRKGYAEGGVGQVHLRENAAVPGTSLVCLHATAYSSRTFEPLLRALDGRVRAIAPDTPGYGESDAPPAPLDIAGYAGALLPALPTRFDLFGYHTGASIAVELAIAHPHRVGRLILMGVPHFAALDFAAWRKKLAAPHRLAETLDQFAERWRFLVTERPAGLSLRGGFENFVDELKAWPDGWRAHEALFAHDLAGRLPLVRQRATVLNVPGHLAEPSRLAAALIPDAEVVELPQLTGAVLDAHAPAIAALIRCREPAPC
ncbi:alpha/beta fold hydrolase [Sphingomonas sp.]|uniref:alpha/beta fold hydrolase n=1 Tax=Sphingomonas sp. TaxID=28214 RepID=UPI003CC56F08